jgi:hypothetical protein
MTLNGHTERLARRQAPGGAFEQSNAFDENALEIRHLTVAERSAIFHSP